MASEDEPNPWAKPTKGTMKDTRTHPDVETTGRCRHCQHPKAHHRVMGIAPHCARATCECEGYEL